MRDEENPEDGRCDLCESRCGNGSLGTCEVCDLCVSFARGRCDGDARIAALEAEVERLREERDAAVDAFDAATPIVTAAEARAERAEAALKELVEVAELRGDNDLPHPANDSNLWSARMQSAWDEASEVVAHISPPAEPAARAVHQWVEGNEIVRWPHCCVCGVVRRKDGGNSKACKGTPRITLRGAEPCGEEDDDA